MSIYKERQAVILQLLGDLLLTDVERAKIAGCSTKTVQRTRARLGREPVNEPSGPKATETILQQFQRHLEKQLPVQECVELLVNIIRQDAHRPSQLAAIKRYQELLGIVTLREAKKLEAPVAQGPMFVFPPGSQPLLTVSPGQAGQARALDEQSSESAVIEAEAVRVEEHDDDR